MEKCLFYLGNFILNCYHPILMLFNKYKQSYVTKGQREVVHTQSFTPIHYRLSHQNYFFFFFNSFLCIHRTFFFFLFFFKFFIGCIHRTTYYNFNLFDSFLLKEEKRVLLPFYTNESQLCSC